MRNVNDFFACRFIAFSLSVILFALPLLSFSAEEGSKVTGKIYKTDAKTPVSGAVVKAYHIESGKLYNSVPTSSSGSYSLSRLPSGYYDVAVETKDGLYVATRAINVPPASKISFSFTITSFAEAPKDSWEGKEKPQMPALQKESSGIANILEKKGQKAFWKSGKGVATILVGSAAVLGIAIASGNDEENASPH